MRAGVSERSMSERVGGGKRFSYLIVDEIPIPVVVEVLFLVDLAADGGSDAVVLLAFALAGGLVEFVFGEGTG